jgi:hypothetical protein
LLAGWHSVEGDPIQGIRWAGPQAHILIRLSEPCRELQLEVSSFDAKNHLFAFLPTDKGTPASNIVVGRHRQVFSVPLPREVGRDGPLISLRIDASRFVCPAWTGESPDERRLGFCLHGLRAV